VSRQGMGQLGDEHHVHQVIEQLQECDLTCSFPVSRSSWRLPPGAKAASQ
jgi:hypothetical protein